MNTKRLAAAGASPVELFGINEITQAVRFNVAQILQHAHTVFGAVTPVQAAEAVAREARAAGTEVAAARFAGLDFALDAGYAFAAVRAAATGAWVSTALKGDTEPAIHAARSDQGGVTEAVLGGMFRHGRLD